ncbi:MAG: recombinase family protein [Oscillospiraceae bacterium]|nr:recombinase family protein [Oscillospiraceae bacterium]
MKAVIYARYSSDNQREESIEGQLRECKDYAERNGYSIVGTYIDRAFSAKTDQRPDFQRMIKDSAKKLFDTVIVWKLDRFARDRYDSARYKNTLKKNGVKVVSAMERISEGPEGIILEAVLEGMAEYYSADLAEKVVRGHTENALKCKCNGGSVAFGLMLDKEQHYVPDPLLAPIVLEVFERYAAGETIKQLCMDLDDRQIRSIKGNRIGFDTMRRMLSNRKYIGEYKYRDIVVPDAFPAIVPKDLFDRVQEMRVKNQKASARHKAENLYLLSTKLFCGKCGSAMDGECGTSSTGKRYNYYKCQSAKKKQGCHKKAISKEWIENLVVKETMFKLNNSEILNSIADAVLQLQGKSNPTLPILETELRQVNADIQNIVNAVQAGMFSKALADRMNQLEAQKCDLEARIIEEKIAKPVFTREQILCWLERYRYLDTSSRKQREWLVRCFIKAVYVYDDKLLITFHYTDDIKTVPLSDAGRATVNSITNRSYKQANGGPNADNPNVLRIGSAFGFLISLEKYL